MTPLAAAKKFAKELEKMGYSDVKVWDKKTAEARGWCKSEAQVACEGANFGVFVEPYNNNWLMTFHKE